MLSAIFRWSQSQMMLIAREETSIQMLL